MSGPYTDCRRLGFEDDQARVIEVENAVFGYVHCIIGSKTKVAGPMILEQPNFEDSTFERAA